MTLDFSIDEMSEDRWGSHIEIIAAYSSVECTRDIYAVSFKDWGYFLRSRRRKPTVEPRLCYRPHSHGDQLSSAERLTPSYLAVSTSMYDDYEGPTYALPTQFMWYMCTHYLGVTTFLTSICHMLTFWFLCVPSYVRLILNLLVTRKLLKSITSGARYHHKHCFCNPSVEYFCSIVTMFSDSW